MEVGTVSNENMDINQCGDSKSVYTYLWYFDRVDLISLLVTVQCDLISPLLYQTLSKARKTLPSLTPGEAK